MKVEQQSITEQDIAAINKLTLREFSQDEIFIFSAKFIDDAPTSNGRIWSREWQQANVNNFVGIPVIVNHENDQSLVLGRVFQAEQKDNAIMGKIYVPLDTEIGREARTKIEAGLFKSISIGARSENVKPDGDNLRILPGDDDRIFELSFVAVPGCLSCHVTNECNQEAKGKPVVEEKGRYCGDDAAENRHERLLLEFAEEQTREVMADFQKTAGFALGKNFNRESYQAIAEQLSPKSLKQLTKDLRHLYEQNKTQQTKKHPDEIEGLKEALRQIRRTKGV